MAAPAPPSRLIALTPNALSVMRLVMAAAFPFVPDAWRAPIVIVAGVSDWLDGWVARRFCVTSWQGGLLDAAADKAVTWVVLITVTIGGALAWWQTALLLLRDVTSICIFCYVVLGRQTWLLRRLGARWAGKLTTIVLFPMFVVLLWWPEIEWLTYSLVALAAALGLIASVDYVARLVRNIRRGPPVASP